MSQALRDPSVGLSCDETPLYPPKTMAIADMTQCPSCTLIFAAPIVGPKTLSSRYANDGLNVDESPLTEVSYNNNKYALFDTVIWKAGAHRNFKEAANYDMEMNLYFRDVFNPLKQIAMAIPITINNSQANPYFTEMANQNPGARTLSLEKIISNGPVVMYKGIDLRARNSDKPYAAQQCQDASSSMQWFILQPTFISSNDAQRIRSTAVPSNLLPPAPQHELTLDRVRNMCTVIPNIRLKSDNQKRSSETFNSENGIYLTRALQCQRINPATDIKNDAVYLNGPPQNNLQDELNNAADSANPVAAAPSVGVRPKQFEDFLALIAGIILGILLVAIVINFILKFLYRGFGPNVSAMDTSILPIISEKTVACASYVTPIVLTGPAGTGIKPIIPDLTKVTDQLSCASSGLLT
jgi:hypothetical protein